MISGRQHIPRSGAPLFVTRQYRLARWCKRSIALVLVFLLSGALIGEVLTLVFVSQHALLAANWPRVAGHGDGNALVSSSLPGQAVTLAEGVTETGETLMTIRGPQQVSLLRVDLSNPHVHLGVVQARDQLFSPGETLTSMAQRSGALAGINGDFFEIHRSGDPLGMVEIDGTVWQSPGQYAVLGVTSSGHVTMGPETFTGSVSAGHESYPLTSINRYSDKGADHLRLYTPFLGSALPVHGATLALLRSVTASSGNFTVTALHTESSELPVLHGQSALVGTDAAGTWLRDHLRVGSSVEISERVAPDNGLAQAIGGGPLIIRDGAVYHDALVPAPGAVNAYNPLTAVGVSKDGRYALFAVCNGRRHDSIRSRGFTYAEMADYLLAYGAYQAMIFDGGGSSELVARLPGQSSISVLNAPSAGSERHVANGLFVYDHAQSGELR